MTRRPRKPPRMRPTRSSATGVAAAAHPRVWYRDALGVLRSDIHAADIAGILARKEGVLWVDIDTTDAAQRALLADLFGFHPLSIEDALTTDGRAKVEEFPDYLLVSVRGVRLATETPELYDVESFNLWCFIAAHVVVTAHGAHAPGVDVAATRIARGDDLLARGTVRVAHAVLDATVDAYFPLVDQIDEFVDGLEERVFVQFDHTALRDIFAVRRLVLQLRRHLAPMREVFNVLQHRPAPFIAPETLVYFRDVYDHVIRINESLETYRELLTSTLDAYLSQVNNRMGMVTKGLTIVATLSVPFVVVSGMWGMNFVRIPLSESPYGFWWMLALQLGLGVGLLALLRRNRWL